MRSCLWILVTWLAYSAAAWADEGVVLREQSGLRGHLCGALRIQLTGTTTVQCEPEGGSAPLDRRIAQTSARVRALGAQLGVLLERDPDPSRLRMYIVSTRSDRAIIEIESIEDRPEPDVDRSLALKVLDAYQVVQVAAAGSANAEPPLAAALTPPPTDPGSPPTPPNGGASPAVENDPENDPGSNSARWHLFLDGGGGASFSSQPRGFASAALGVARAHAGMQLELGAGIRLASRVQEQSDPGQVTVLERGPLLAGRLVWQQGRFAIGGGVDALLLWMAGEGVASDGARGRQRQLVPALALALELRLRLFGTAFLRLAPALEVSAVRQRWAVDGTVLVDQGRARVNLPLSLLVLLPLSQE